MCFRSFRSEKFILEVTGSAEAGPFGLKNIFEVHLDCNNLDPASRGTRGAPMLAWLDRWVVQVQENDERAIREKTSSQSRSITGASRSGMDRWERDGERDGSLPPQRPASRTEHLTGSSSRRHSTNPMIR